MKKILAIIFLILFFFVGVLNFADAAQRVSGYRKKNGTYVQPYYRSNPDGNPYNNWSYPGNTNPYTGKIAPGKSSTYLDNYCKNSPNNSYCSGRYNSKNTKSGIYSNQNSPKTTVYTRSNLLALPNNSLIRRIGSKNVYLVENGKKYWIPTAERFKTFGYKWSNIKIVSNDFTNEIRDGVLTYKTGSLVKSSRYPFVWLLESDATLDNGNKRKWIPNANIFTKCGFKWSNIVTIPESEIQSMKWEGDNSLGKINSLLCN